MYIKTFWVFTDISIQLKHRESLQGKLYKLDAGTIVDCISLSIIPCLLCKLQLNNLSMGPRYVI